MIRAHVVHSSTVTVDLPYQASLDTTQGKPALSMPLDGAVSLYHALKDLLVSEGTLQLPTS
jgi:hypothetical protein